MLFSARSKRSLVTLGVTLGIFLGWLVVYPVMITSATLDPVTNDLAKFLDPNLSIQKMWRPNAKTQMADDDPDNPRNKNGVAPQFFGFPQALIYLGLAGVCLFWAERTLRFADGEAQFLPGSRNA